MGWGSRGVVVVAVTVAACGRVGFPSTDAGPADAATRVRDAGRGSGRLDSGSGERDAGRPRDAETPACATDGGCECGESETCDLSCPTGDCAFVCRDDSTCTAECTGSEASCSLDCGSGATCTLVCPMGTCVVSSSDSEHCSTGGGCG